MLGDNKREPEGHGVAQYCAMCDDDDQTSHLFAPCGCLTMLTLKQDDLRKTSRRLKTACLQTQGKHNNHAVKIRSVRD